MPSDEFRLDDRREADAVVVPRREVGKAENRAVNSQLRGMRRYFSIRPCRVRCTEIECEVNDEEQVDETVEHIDPHRRLIGEAAAQQNNREHEMYEMVAQ